MMTFAFSSTVFALLAPLLVCSSLSLRIEIAPVEYTEEHSGQVNVTCRMDSTDVGDVDIYVMEIVDNDGQPIVFVRNSGLSFGDDYTNSVRFEVEGSLENNLMDSFLRLSINEPKAKDQGEYTCKIFFLDGGYLKERRASGNLTVDKIDINHEVRQLLAKVATLQKELQGKTETERDLTDKISQLTKQFVNETQIQEAKDIELSNKIDRLTNTTDKLENRADNLEDLDLDLSDKIDRLTNTTDKLENRTDNLEDLATYTTFFSASLSANVDVASGGVVKFNRVLVNDKNAYDRSTGIFKVPRSGVYAFHLVLTTYCVSCGAWVHIKSNDVILASLYAHDSNDYDQSSVSCVKYLMEGDLVRVVAFDITSKLHSSHTASLFSGYLVRPV